MRDRVCLSFVEPAFGDTLSTLVTASSRQLAKRLLVSCAAMGIALACYAPTQLTVDIASDLDCPRAGIYVGSSLASAEIAAVTDRCERRDASTVEIGTFVLVPKGDRDAKLTMHFVAAVGRDPETCRGGPSASCVVARRIVSFIPHKSRTLRVRLDRVCQGVYCPEDQTCVGGRCRSALVGDDDDDCAGCGATDGGPDGGADADAETTDANGDAPTQDAGPPCPGATAGGVVATTAGLADFVAVTSDRVVWVVESAGDTNVFSKRLAAGEVPVSHGQITGQPTSLFAESNRAWVGTSVGLGTTAFAGGDLQRHGGVFPVTSVVARSGTAYVSTTDPGGKASLVAATPGAATTLIDLYPKALLALGSGTQVFALATSTGNVDELSLTPSSATIIQSISGPVKSVWLAVGDGAPYVSTTGSSPASIVRVGGAEHCFISTGRRIAADSTGIYALDQTPDLAVLVRCPAPGVLPLGLPPTAVPLETTRYTAVAALAVSPDPNGCVYFSAVVAGSGPISQIRATRRYP